MTEHYLDNSATTKVSDGACEKILELLKVNFANPSSLHSKGFEASKELEASREVIAEALGANAEEIIFTSGGTEANNLAVLGAAEALKKRGNRIITTAYEHSSVYEAAEHLRSQGFDVVILTPDSKGQISDTELFEALSDKTILVSVMYVNNEVGSINPVERFSTLIKKKAPNALFHVDAVQAFGKIPFKVSKIKCDLLTISAHKIHGPKGAGALYIRKGARILPKAFGGKQEKKLRPGTEALPLIAGFSKAVSELCINENYEKVSELSGYLREKLSEIEGVVINSTEDALPYIVNFSTSVIRSETMLHFLAGRGVYVSSGSACSKGAKSHVLSSLGLSDTLLDTAIRVSFSKHNTKDDCDALIEGVREGINTLAKR